MADAPSQQKQRILRAAARLFAAKGYDATGVAEIGQAVGLGRGALYHHIGSKETLLYEISVAHVVGMVTFGEEVVARDLPAEDKFRLLARRLMSTIADNLAELTVFFADFRALTGSHHREIRDMRRRFENVWAAILEQGVRDGSFRETDPLVVKGILGMFNYSYLWLRPRGHSPEEIADAFSELVLRGLEPHPGEASADGLPARHRAG